MRGRGDKPKKTLAVGAGKLRRKRDGGEDERNADLGHVAGYVAKV